MSVLPGILHMSVVCCVMSMMRQFSCCEAIKILQIEEGMGMGKENVTDGSE